MRSPTVALLWGIWQRHRAFVAAIAIFTAAGWLVDGGEPSTLNEMLGLLSFVLLFGIFTYTEVSEDGGVGRFPHRLFTLPVSTLRLVAVPVVAGVVSVELLYLLWMDRLTRGGMASPLFVGVLFAALMVFYHAVVWTLARLGPLRLVVLGAIGLAVFVIGLLPSFTSLGVSPWRSERVLGTLAAGLAVAAFLLAWRHVARLRSGGGYQTRRLERLIGRLAVALPVRRRAFASPLAAQFWFEWRSSGMALPALVGGVLLMAIGPLSWLGRHDPNDTLRLLLGTLAMPVILAIPIGMAFAKPVLWSDDLSVPAFMAVRPLQADDFIETKVKVAAMSVAISWLVVLSFVGVWLSLWANLESARGAAPSYGVAVLFVIAAMLLTWRFMITSLWSGLSGNRRLFIASVAPVALVVMAWLISDASGLIDWVLEDPSHLTPVVWTLAVAVIAKYALAVYSWRRIAPRHIRSYLLVWLGGTACFVTLAVQLRGSLEGVAVLLAVMAVPLARIGLAPSFLARNRHRGTAIL